MRDDKEHWNIVTDLSQNDNKNKTLRKKINKYIAGYVAALKQGKVKLSSGDCLYCQFQTINNVSLGDSIGDIDHLESHFKERYYVGALLINATNQYPVSLIASHCIREYLAGDRSNTDIEYLFGMVENQVVKSLSNYLCHAFKIPK